MKIESQGFLYIDESNQIQELLGTVLEAIEYSRKNKEEAKTYANDCIYALQHIEEFLNMKNIKHDIKDIKDAVECLNKVMLSTEVSQVGRWLNQSRRHVMTIKNKISSEVKVKYKIVFLPYKSSMWTSFHSIWEEAIIDENCECIVMPIPYYQLDSEGNIETFKYEDTGYPEEVEITNYKEFDLEKELPDVIFIHNPYDGTNKVTRVDEKYYAKNLRQYTKQLVYSPYYTFRYYNPKKRSLVCMTPGTIYSNKILVQSEIVKKMYMDHGHSENRLMTLGSPKIDNVVKTIKNPPEVPTEWANKIKNRKVFLLNTHMLYFSKKKEAAFGMLEKILDFFDGNKEYFLIWRPHPLTQVELESKFPDLYSTYLDKIKYASSLENCIIDNFGEYSYSFTISDAMISTYSSLVTEYMVSGKPVYIIEKENNRALNRQSPVDYSLNYYYMENDFELDKFIKMVDKNIDEKREERMNMVRKAFLNSKDGSCGKKVYTEIVEGLLINK